MSSILYARLKTPKVMSFIYGKMAKTGRTMGEILDAMVDFCGEPEFVIAKKPDKSASAKAAEKRRMKKYLKLSKSK